MVPPVFYQCSTIDEDFKTFIYGRTLVEHWSNLDPIMEERGENDG